MKSKSTPSVPRETKLQGNSAPEADIRLDERPLIPISNYTLASVCPACNYPTIRRACKVRCERCGFVWDCSEL